MNFCSFKLSIKWVIKWPFYKIYSSNCFNFLIYWKYTPIWPFVDPLSLIFLFIYPLPVICSPICPFVRSLSIHFAIFKLSLIVVTIWPYYDSPIVLHVKHFPSILIRVNLTPFVKKYDWNQYNVVLKSQYLLKHRLFLFSSVRLALLWLYFVGFSIIFWIIIHSFPVFLYQIFIL